MTSEGFIPTAL